jgi:hypothetical protein
MLKLEFAGDEHPSPPDVSDAADVHVWYNRAGGVVARGFAYDGYRWMAWPCLATFRFAPHDPCITAFPDPYAPADIIWDTYRRSVLPMALQARGLEALHASAITGPTGVVAFCAASETGKSTIAFGLRRRGFPQWADDGVVFRAGPEGATAFPLPFEARLRAGSRKIFGSAAPLASRFQHNGPGEQVHTAPAPLAALYLLERATADAIDGPARIETVSPQDAFSALLVHAHVFNPLDQTRLAQMLRTYLELVARVPVFTIQFSPAHEHFNDLLDWMIDSTGLELPSRSASLCGS